MTDMVLLLITGLAAALGSQGVIAVWPPGTPLAGGGFAPLVTSTGQTVPWIPVAPTSMSSMLVGYYDGGITPPSMIAPQASTASITVVVAGTPSAPLATTRVVTPTQAQADIYYSELAAGYSPFQAAVLAGLA